MRVVVRRLLGDLACDVRELTLEECEVLLRDCGRRDARVPVAVRTAFDARPSRDLFPLQSAMEVTRRLCQLQQPPLRAAKLVVLQAEAALRNGLASASDAVCLALLHRDLPDAAGHDTSQYLAALEKWWRVTRYGQGGNEWAFDATSGLDPVMSPRVAKLVAALQPELCPRPTTTKGEDAKLAFKVLRAMLKAKRWGAGDADWLYSVIIRTRHRRVEKVAHVETALTALQALESVGDMRFGAGFLAELHRVAGENISKVRLATMRWVIHRTAPVAMADGLVYLPNTERAHPHPQVSDAVARNPFYHRLFQIDFQVKGEDLSAVAKLFETLCVLAAQADGSPDDRRQDLLPGVSYHSLIKNFVMRDGRAADGYHTLGVATNINVCHAHVLVSRRVPDVLLDAMLAAVGEHGVEGLVPLAFLRYVRVLRAAVCYWGALKGRAVDISVAVEAAACHIVDVLEQRDVAGRVPAAHRVPLAEALADTLSAAPAAFATIGEVVAAAVIALLPMELPPAAPAPMVSLQALVTTSEGAALSDEQRWGTAEPTVDAACEDAAASFPPVKTAWHPLFVPGPVPRWAVVNGCGKAGPVRVVLSEKARRVALQRLYVVARVHRVAAKLAKGVGVKPSDGKFSRRVLHCCAFYYSASVTMLRAGGADGACSPGARRPSSETWGTVVVVLDLLKELALLRSSRRSEHLCVTAYSIFAQIFQDVAASAAWRSQPEMTARREKTLPSRFHPMATMVWACETLLPKKTSADGVAAQRAYTRCFLDELANDAAYFDTFSDADMKRIVWAVSQSRPPVPLREALEARVLRGDLTQMSHAWYEGCKLCFERMSISPHRLRIAYEGHHAKDKQTPRRQNPNRHTPSTSMDAIVAKWVGPKAEAELGAKDWFQQPQAGSGNAVPRLSDVVRPAAGAPRVTSW